MKISTLVLCYQLAHTSLKIHNERQSVLIELRDKITRILKVHPQSVQDSLSDRVIPLGEFLEFVARNEVRILTCRWNDLK